MLWVGAIVLVLGVAFFLKYAFDNQWITESMRVGLGLAGGLALVAAGHQFVRRGYAGYGQILAGGGLAVLYLSVFAAHSFYDLVGRTTAFALLLAVTVGAAVLADRQRAAGLAVMAVGGGFLTPFLVGGARDAQVTLFTYDALLVAGTMYLARRHDWPVLNALSFGATWLTIGAWADAHYTGAKWLRTELFLTLFAGLFVWLLRENVRRRGVWDGVSLVLATGPVIYHLASLAVLGDHGVALLVYLIAVTVAGVSLSVRADSVAWRVVTWSAAVPPLLEWIGAHQSARWMLASLVTAAAVFALHALAQLDRVFRSERRLEGADLVLLHVNGLALVLAAYLALEQVALTAAPAVVLIVAIAHGLIAWRYRGQDPAAALHALAVAISTTAIATALQLDGAWLTVALGVEGALVVVLGLRLTQAWFRLGGAALLAVAGVRWLALSALEPPLATYGPLRDEPFVLGITLVLLLAAVAWQYHRHAATDPHVASGGRTGFAVAASILLIVVCSFENGAYWDVYGYGRSDARFARSLSLSFVWIVLATGLITAGLRWRFPPVRYVAMALFGVTVLKVFLVDLSSLGGIYRILGFIGVGLVLLAVSFLYQRGRRRSNRQKSPAPDTVAAGHQQG